MDDARSEYPSWESILRQMSDSQLTAVWYMLDSFAASGPSNLIRGMLIQRRGTDANSTNAS